MSLYQRQAHGVWYYEFVVGGKRHRASTRTTNRAKALAVESQAQADLQGVAIQREAYAVGDRAPEPGSITRRSRIVRGRRAWGTVREDSHRRPNSLLAARDRRERWREIGEALVEGRAVCADAEAFVAWRKAERLAVPGLTSYAAMWLAENWKAVADLETTVSHPAQLLRLHRSGELAQMRRTGLTASPFTMEQRAAIRDMLNGLRSRVARKVLPRYEVRDGQQYACIEHCPTGDDFGPAPRWPLVSIALCAGDPPLYRVLCPAPDPVQFLTLPEALRAAKVVLLRHPKAPPPAAQ